MGKSKSSEINKWVELYTADLYSWARYKVSDAELAKDLVQDTFLGDIEKPFFQADKILTLAASKKILYNLNSNTEIYIADLGIPKEVYSKFGIEPLPFHENNIIKLKC